MSGIAGIYNLDGCPVDRAVLRRMTDAIRHRGPDAEGCWISNSVGLGHRMLRTTPESLREDQPLTDPSGKFCVTFDGRVDNRKELKAALASEGEELRQESDPELVLLAYKCWGERSVGRIVGDFAFVIWDGEKQRLFCARDVFGIKPFYYHASPALFLCGSELRQILEGPSVPRQPNEGMVGEYLSFSVTNKEETLYQSILRLPPAHYLLVKPDGVCRKCYWDFDLSRQCRLKSDHEYAEHFAEIFQEAVRCRLRSAGPVGAELSGGLDSSSVVCMAQSLYGRGLAEDSGFETFSMVFPGLPCDESGYIHEVVEKWGFQSNEVNLTLAENSRFSDPSLYLELARLYCDFSGYPNDNFMDPLRRLAQEKGLKILLTGIGGDEFLGGSQYQYADLLHDGRIREFFRQIRLDPRSPRRLLRSLAESGILPLLPGALQRLGRRVLGRNTPSPCLPRDFTDRIHLTDRIRVDENKNGFQSFSQGFLYRISTHGEVTHMIESSERALARFGIEFRHPFMDRRLAEFALALPEPQRYRISKGQIKFVLRQAMQGFLPENVRQRIGKPGFAHVFIKALQHERAEEVFSDLSIAAMGWVNVDKVQQLYERTVGEQEDLSYRKYLWDLWMIFGIDIWFKTTF